MSIIGTVIPSIGILEDARELLGKAGVNESDMSEATPPGAGENHSAPLKDEVQTAAAETARETLRGSLLGTF